MFCKITLRFSLFLLFLTISSFSITEAKAFKSIEEAKKAEFTVKETTKDILISNGIIELKFYEEVWGPPLRELQQVVESGFTIKPICDLNKQLLISVAKGQKIKIYINELKIIFCYLSKQSLPNINKWKIQESPEDTDKKLVFIVERKEENQSKQMRANLTANFMVRISDDDTESLMDTYFVEWKGWYSLDAENGWTPEKNIIYNFSRIPHDSGGTQTNNDN